MDLFILRHSKVGKRLQAVSKHAASTLTVTDQKEVEDIAKSIKDLS